MNWYGLVMIFLGGGCGSVCRWGLSLGLKRYAATLGGLPIQTLVANFVGCLLIGMATAWLSRHQHPQLALLLTTGFCGGFTTFSTFSLESLGLLRSGQVGMGLLYVALSLAVCLGAVALGLWLMPPRN